MFSTCMQKRIQGTVYGLVPLVCFVMDLGTGTTGHMTSQSASLWEKNELCAVAHSEHDQTGGKPIAGTSPHFITTANDSECCQLCLSLLPQCNAWVRQPSTGHCWPIHGYDHRLFLMRGKLEYEESILRKIKCVGRAKSTKLWIRTLSFATTASYLHTGCCAMPCFTDLSLVPPVSLQHQTDPWEFCRFHGTAPNEQLWFHNDCVISAFVQN